MTRMLKSTWGFGALMVALAVPSHFIEQRYGLPPAIVVVPLTLGVLLALRLCGFFGR
jgi:hypothetical protein